MTLLNQLGLLESSNLIALAQIEPELEYLFRHALVQEAAYASMLREDRRRLHRIAGDILEQGYAQRIDELAPMLARHFAIAGDNTRALKYFTMAGDRAFSVYANQEALIYYAEALGIARRTADIDPVSLLHLYMQRGRALELLSRFEEALLHYTEMESTAQRIGARGLELASLTARATIHITVNFVYDPHKGQAYLEKARALAHAIDDRAAEAKILWNLMLLNVTGDLDARTRYGEQALALARELNLREQMAYVLTDLWYAYAGAGQWARGLEALNESCELWRELDNKTMLAESTGRIYLSHIARGEYTQALRFFEEMRGLAETIGSRDMQALCRFMIGFVYLEHGAYGQAIGIMEEAIALAEPVGNVTVLIGTRSLLAWSYGLLGQIDRGLALAHAARRTAQEYFMGMYPWAIATLTLLHLSSGDATQAKALLPELGDYRGLQQALGFIPFMWIEVALAQGEFGLATGDATATLQLANELLANMQQANIRFLLPDVLLLKARALLAQKDHTVARETLLQAQAEAQALDSQRTLWEILTLRSRIETREKADLLRVQAEQIVREIAAGIDRPEWRDSFLHTVQTRLSFDIQSIM